MLLTVEACQLHAFTLSTCFHCSAEHSVSWALCAIGAWRILLGCVPFSFSHFWFSNLALGDARCRTLFNAELPLAPCRRLFCFLVFYPVGISTLISLPLVAIGMYHNRVNSSITTLTVMSSRTFCFLRFGRRLSLLVVARGILSIIGILHFPTICLLFGYFFDPQPLGPLSPAMAPSTRFLMPVSSR